MTESDTGGTAENGPAEQLASNTSGARAWVLAAVSLTALVLVYKFWGPIVRFVDMLAMTVVLCVVFGFIVWGIVSVLTQIFEKKNTAAAIFVVGSFAIVAWLIVRLLF